MKSYQPSAISYQQVDFGFRVSGFGKLEPMYKPFQQEALAPCNTASKVNKQVNV
jgi:hypothetical protein